MVRIDLDPGEIHGGREDMPRSSSAERLDTKNMIITRPILKDKGVNLLPKTPKEQQYYYSAKKITDKIYLLNYIESSLWNICVRFFILFLCFTCHSHRRIRISSYLLDAIGQSLLLQGRRRDPQKIYNHSNTHL